MKKNIGPWSVLLLILLGSIGYTSLTSERRIREPIETTYTVESKEFRDSLGNLLGAPLVEGNTMTELLNGDEIFGSMLDAIKSAKKTITFEMYIWSSGKESDRFVNAFIDRARNGVKVHVIVDTIGSAKLKK